MASEVCPPHSGIVLNSPNVSRPRSSKFSLAISASRPKTENTIGNESFRSSCTEKTEVSQRPKTARPMTRRSRTFIATEENIPTTDSNPDNRQFLHNEQNSHYDNQTTSGHVMDSYYLTTGYGGSMPFHGVIRDDEDYYLNMDPIEYFYNPVFDLYPYGYVLTNVNNDKNSKKNIKSKEFQFPLNEQIFQKASKEPSITTNKKNKEANVLHTKPPLPKSKLPVPVANPTLKKLTGNYGTITTVQTIEYRKDLFETKQKPELISSLTNETSTFSPGYQTEQTKPVNRHVDSFSNSRINPSNQKNKPNDVLKLDMPGSYIEHIENKQIPRKRSALSNQSIKRVLSRERCSGNKLQENSNNSTNCNVSKKWQDPGVKVLLKDQVISGSEKQSLKVRGNRENSYKQNDKWALSSRQSDNRSFITKTKLNENIQKHGLSIKPSNQRHDKNRPFSEDSNMYLTREQPLDHKIYKKRTHLNEVKLKGLPPRASNKITLPKIRPQSDRFSVITSQPTNASTGKLKPVLVKFEENEF